MSRDYRSFLRRDNRWHSRWWPGLVLVGFAVAVAVQLLEPRATLVQTLRLANGQALLRLEKRRYVRRDDWVVRLWTGWRWRTLYYWSSPTNKAGTNVEVRLQNEDASNVVLLVVGGAAVWSYHVNTGMDAMLESPDNMR